MYEDPAMFANELATFFAFRGSGKELDRWHLLEAHYPELLAGWLTVHPEFEPPQEVGVRIGKRPDHYQGGRRNI